MKAPLPMFANAATIEDARTRYSKYIMQYKFDGVRCILVKDNDTVTMLTRTHHHMEDKLPHLAAFYGKVLDNGTIIDGEVGYYSGGVFDFNRTMRVIGSGPDEALRKQQGDVEGDRITFIPFDCLAVRHADITALCYEDRMDFLEEVLGDHSATPLWFPGFQEDAYVAYVNMGGEGMMLKDPQGLYVPGKRPAHVWMKLKAFETIDVVIMNYIPGKGKYEGLVGALTFGQVNKEGDLVLLGKCSGMTDDERELMTKLFLDGPQHIVRKVMEIRYFGKVGIDGSGLRHPQYVRLRPDKDWRECTLGS